MTSIILCNTKVFGSLLEFTDDTFMDINFKALAKKRTYQVGYPNANQRKNHIDFILRGRCPRTKKSTSVTIDLKSYKLSKKPGGKNLDTWQWLELRNIHGLPGWVYGRADFIVFETRRSFILVNRLNLAKWVVTESKIDFSRFVKKPWDSKYKLYKREGKKEELTQVKTTDLFNIKGTVEWPK